MDPRPAGPASGSFPRDLLRGDPLAAARVLLGAHLLRAGRGGVPARLGRVVEVEAYGDEADGASHARFGPTPRNRVMFGPPGIAYVYLVYGMHHCLNVVVGPPGRAAAVLIRAVEPVAGAGAMRDARVAAGRGSRRPLADTRLASGPGLVGEAFGIDLAMTGVDLCDPASPLRLLPATLPTPAAPVVTTPRIGIGYAPEPWASAPWRLLLADSPSVSGPRARRPSRPAPPDR